MNTQPDFEEFLSLLEKHNVDYMIVGGYAVAFHGYPRFTHDLDIFYDLTPENVARLRAAVLEFGFQEDQIGDDTFVPKSMATFGVPPLRVDLLNDIDGVTFAEARQRVVTAKYGRANAKFIGRDDLLRNKRATNRGKDRADLEELD